MTCKSCHRTMDLVRFVAAGGSDGSVQTRVYRCVQCWKEKTVTEPRKRQAFEGKANL